MLYVHQSLYFSDLMPCAIPLLCPGPCPLPTVLRCLFLLQSTCSCCPGLVSWGNVSCKLICDNEGTGECAHLGVLFPPRWQKWYCGIDTSAPFICEIRIALWWVGGGGDPKLHSKDGFLYRHTLGQFCMPVPSMIRSLEQ